MSIFAIIGLSISIIVAVIGGVAVTIIGFAFVEELDLVGTLYECGEKLARKRKAKRGGDAE